MFSMHYQTSRYRYFGCTFPAIACLFIAAPALADDPADLVDFFAGHGCAIGPTTRDAAIAAGFAATQIDALVDAEAGREGAVTTGDWLVIAPDACRMRPPEIGGTLQLSDPELEAMLSKPDPYADHDGPGCFLDGTFLETLSQSRGWDADTTFREYIQLVGRSLILGEMTFYSDSPLATPAGFQSTVGICADRPAAAEIRRGHEFMIRNFDPIMRAMMAANTCDDSSGWPASVINDLPGITPDLSTSNSWTFFEVEIIAIAAGWYEGVTATEKGVPRPPLCHYADPSSPVDLVMPPPAPAPQAAPVDERSPNRKARRNSGGP